MTDERICLCGQCSRFHRQSEPCLTLPKRGTPFFVYGTLRQKWFDRGGVGAPVCYADEPDMDATAHGCLWFAYSGGYPVAKFADTWEGTIKGDVIWVDVECPDWQEVVEIERQARYAVVEVEATLASGEVIEAKAFHYQGVPADTHLIPDGDWIKAWKALHA